MTTPLSNFDSRYAYMAFGKLYFYDYKLDETKLQQSLDEVINIFPQLSSTIQEVENTIPGSKIPKLQFVHEPIGFVKIKVDYCKDESIFEYGKLNSKGISKQEEEDVLMNFLDPVELGYPHKTNVPVLKIKLTHFPNNKSILGISLNHSVADAQSYFTWVHYWAEINRLGVENAKIKIPNHRRDLLSIPSKDFATRKVSDEQLKKLGMYYEPNFSEIQQVMSSSKWRWKFITFTPESITRLKKYALEGKAGEKLKNRIVSTNDVCCCHIWKILTKLRKTSDDTLFPLLMQYNFRRVYSKIDENYFGNAVTYVILEKPRKEILEKDFSELVLDIRNMVDSFNEQDVQDVLDVHERNVAPFPKGLLNVKTGMTTTSWAKYDMYDVDFEKGRPIRVVTPSKGAFPYLITIRNVPGGGVTFMTGLSEEMINKLNEFEDLTDPKIIDKL